MSSEILGKALAQKLTSKTIQIIHECVLVSLEENRPEVLGQLGEQYYFEDKLIPAMSAFVQNDKTHILLIVWGNKKIAEGSSLAELISLVGQENFLEILEFLGRVNIGGLSQIEGTQLLHFLNHLILNTDVGCIKEWLQGNYSQLVFLSLDKNYLKKIFIEDPSLIQVFSVLKETVLSEDERNAVTFVPRIVDLMMQTFGSLSNIETLEQMKKSADLLEKILENVFISLSVPVNRKSTIHVLEERLFVIKVKLFKEMLTVKFGEDQSRLNLLDTVFGLVKSISQSVKFGVSGNREFVRQNLYNHYEAFQKFQAMIFNNFAEKVKSYVIKSVGNYNSREKLEEIFSYLSEQDLILIAGKLNIYVPSDTASSDAMSRVLIETAGSRTLVEECLIYYLALRVPVLERIKRLPVYPTEKDIFLSKNRILELDSQDSDLKSKRNKSQKNEQGNLRNNLKTSNSITTAFDIDRITLSYHNIEDYLIRHFNLFKFMFALELRAKLENLVKLLNPKFEKRTGKFLEFAGWTQYSVEIQRFIMHNVAPLSIGESAPKKVLAEANYSLVESQLSVKQFWESLREFDSVILLLFEKEIEDSKIQGDEDTAMSLEGGESETQDLSSEKNFLKKYGLKIIRGAELQTHYDAKRNKISSKDPKNTDFKPKGFQRSLLLDLDHNQYRQDFSGDQQGSEYAKFNAAIRRDERDTNFKAYLNLILRHFEGDIKFDPWVQKVITGEAYSQEFQQEIMSNQPETLVDISSAFSSPASAESRLTYQKLIESLGENQMICFKPNLSNDAESAKLNYTFNQLQAISRSMIYGVSLIYGPPGTGKTDVCVEIVQQLLKNFADERILLITHSNAALNDIFEKISATPSFEKERVVRLGMGHEKLNLKEDYSKTGRINHFLTKRLQLLQQVEEIAESVSPTFKMQFTCETAEIFFQTQILSRWNEFKQKSQKSIDHASLLKDFPFGKFFPRKF